MKNTASVDDYDTKRPELWSRTRRRSDTGVAGAAGPASRRERPPPPCVEDEEEAIAEEDDVGFFVSSTSDEGPKHRGELDQWPILVPVHDHNPERRFVVVPGTPE